MFNKSIKLKVVSAFVLLSFISSIALAGEVTADQKPWWDGYMEFVPNVDERTNNDDYEVIDGWQRIEIIKEGVINKRLAKRIDTKHWDEDVDINDLYELSVRQPFASKKWAPRIVEDKSRLFVQIPMVVGVRFMEKSNLDLLKNKSALFQGTNEALVEVQFEFIGDNIKIVVGYHRFSGSNGGEMAGRILGSIDQYDDNFTYSVLNPFIKAHFSVEENREKLFEMLNLDIEELRSVKLP